MRYIPDTGKQFVLQVPEDKNSYINVKNLDARGLSTIFSGTVFSAVEDSISIGEITDGAEGTLQQYLDVLSVGIELQAHIYRTISSGSAESRIINVSGVNLQGVDFSSSGVSSTAVQPLKYYIFGYDTSTGKMPYAVDVVGSSGDYSKVLDPDKWNQDQYVDIDFTRTGQYVVPIIYRVWGSRVDFLGMIGNGKIGYPGASVLRFRDYGNTEIPSWNNNPEYWTPSFLENVITSVGGVPTQQRKIVGKEYIKILPRVDGSQPNYIQCSAVQGTALLNSLNYVYGDEVRFIIDDTKPIVDAITLAATGNIKDVFFPAGTYYFRNSSFINSAVTGADYSNITLRGVGEGSIIKRMPSNISVSTNPGLLNFSGAGESFKIEGIRIRSLVLDGNKSSTASLLAPVAGSVDPSRSNSEALLYLRYANNIAVTESRFIDSGGTGMHSEYSSGIFMTGNIFTRLGRSYEQEVRPIEVYNTSSSIIQGNIFEFCTSGPYFFGVDFSTINNNIIRSCGDQGIILETSDQWNAANNLAYSDSDSLIRSIDQYNNEYAKAPIEIRRGSPLEPIYFTVTNGGESIGIEKDSIVARIYRLDSVGRKNNAGLFGGFKVLQTKDQLDAGIFSVTLPALEAITTAVPDIPATSDFYLIDPSNNQFGYMYEISATVRLGASGSGYTPSSIRKFGTQYLAISLKNSSELLSFLFFDADSPENDSIVIEGFSNSNAGVVAGTPYQVRGIDADSNSLLIDSIPGYDPGEQTIEFVGGKLFIQRENYQIADGNIFVN